MCGVVAVISDGGRPVVRDLANGAHFLQHRGPAYAGIFIFDPVHRQATLEKGEGLADDIFKQLGGVPGDTGIAQTRYKTIGRGGRDIPRSRAMDHVFGYTIVNDVTARDVQMRHQQWDLGKSFDTFCPMGPCIVTAAGYPEYKYATGHHLGRTVHDGAGVLGLVAEAQG